MFDLSIIGGGPGGYETALEAARRGLKVALYCDAFGGTCLNEGCIPTKALAHSAEVALEVQKAASFGVKATYEGIDFQTVMSRKDAIVGGLSAGVEAMLRASENITIIPGRVSFPLPSPSTKTIIATGSVNAVLPIPGAETCLGSREVLSLSELPSSLAIIGGGVIGVEIASIMNAFGVQVTVVEYCKEILPFFDDELAKRLRRELSGRGVEFVLGAQVTSVRDGHEVVYIDKKGAEKSVEAASVLMAVGRRPNVDDLNLDSLGVQYSRRGIAVDEYQRVLLTDGTPSPDLYAVGDVTGGKMLAHAATAQGKIALAHILGEPCGVRLDICPAAVFTTPALASVGLREADAPEGAVVRKSLYRANGKAQCIGAVEGVCKIVLSPEDGILGATIMGAGADLLIQQVADVMALGGTYSDLKEIIHIHPTLSEVLI